MSPNVFESLCTLRNLIETDSQAMQVMSSKQNTSMAQRTGIESTFASEKEMIYFLKPICESAESEERIFALFV